MGVITDPGQVKAVISERDAHIKGGVDVLLVGSPGCGKTTALCQIALSNLMQYNDIIVWRSSADCQWSLFKNVDVKLIFWMRKGVKMKMFDRNTGKVVQLKDYVDEVREWKTSEDLVGRLEKNCINIVQTIPYTPVDPQQHIAFCREWVNIFYALNQRMWSTTVSICVDELEDLVPEGQSGDFWSMELALSGIIRALRKNGVSSFLASHSLQEVHWRIRKKIRWFMYMKGSSPIQESAVKSTKYLKIGEAILESDSFEKFHFESLGDDILLRGVLTIDKKVIKL